MKKMMFATLITLGSMMFATPAMFAQGCPKKAHHCATSMQSPYSHTIQRGDEHTAADDAAAQYPTVLLRNVSVTDQRAFIPALTQALEADHYSVIDQQTYQEIRNANAQNRQNGNQDAGPGVNFFLDVAVTQASYASASDGNGANLNLKRLFLSGNDNKQVTGGTFDVAISMFDARTGRNLPGRSGRVTVRSIVQRSSNGGSNLGISIVSLNGQTYKNAALTDPATEAAIRGIIVLFQMGR